MALHFKIDKLNDSSDYEYWSTVMTHYLKALGLWDVVCNDSRAKYTSQIEQKAKFIILSSIKPTDYPADDCTAKSLWDFLKDTYGSDPKSPQDRQRPASALHIPLKLPALVLPQKTHTSTPILCKPLNIPTLVLPQQPQTSASILRKPHNIPTPILPQQSQTSASILRKPLNIPTLVLPQQPQKSASILRKPHNIPTPILPQQPQTSASLVHFEQTEKLELDVLRRKLELESMELLEQTEGAAALPKYQRPTLLAPTGVPVEFNDEESSKQLTKQLAKTYIKSVYEAAALPKYKRPILLGPTGDPIEFYNEESSEDSSSNPLVEPYINTPHGAAALPQFSYSLEERGVRIESYEDSSEESSTALAEQNKNKPYRPFPEYQH